MRDDAVLGRALPLDRGLGPNVPVAGATNGFIHLPTDSVKNTDVRGLVMFLFYTHGICTPYQANSTDVMKKNIFRRIMPCN